jgi:hypothetical protein
MSEIVLQVLDDALLAMKIFPDELGKELRLALAIKLFEPGKLSSVQLQSLQEFHERSRQVLRTRGEHFSFDRKKISRRKRALPKVICNTSPLQIAESPLLCIWSYLDDYGQHSFKVSSSDLGFFGGFHAIPYIC